MASSLLSGDCAAGEGTEGRRVRGRVGEQAGRWVERVFGFTIAVKGQIAKLALISRALQGPLRQLMICTRVRRPAHPVLEFTLPQTLAIFTNFG
eukprot:6915622-Alexandrium_andersonii.AAC.1